MAIAVITENTSQQNGAAADDVYTGVEDNGRMKEDDTTFKGWSFARVDADKYTTGEDHRSLIRFAGISNIPSNAVVSDATIYLRQVSSNGSDDVEFRRVLRAWDLDSTWDDWKSGSTWTTGGCGSDGNDRESTSIANTTVANDSLYHSFTDATNLVPLVQGWVDGTYANDGLLLFSPTPNASQFKGFASSDGTDGQMPELLVTYTVSSGVVILRRRMEG